MAHWHNRIARSWRRATVQHVTGGFMSSKKGRFVVEWKYTEDSAECRAARDAGGEAEYSTEGHALARYYEVIAFTSTAWARVYRIGQPGDICEYWGRS